MQVFKEIIDLGDSYWEIESKRKIDKCVIDRCGVRVEGSTDCEYDRKQDSLESIIDDVIFRIFPWGKGNRIEAGD